MDTYTLFRFPSLLFSFVLLLALALGACSSGEKTSADNALSPEGSSSKAESEPATAAGGIVNGSIAITPRIADAAVSTPKIADGAVTNPRIADDAVTSSRIMTGQVMTVDIADLAVTTAKIDDDATAPDVRGWTSLGATVVDGDASTGNPPPAQGTTARLQTEYVPDALVMNTNVGHDAVLTLPMQETGTTTGQWSFAITSAGTSEKDRRVILNETILTQDIATGAVTTTEILNIPFDDMNGPIARSDSSSTGNREQQNVQEIIPDVQQIPEPIYENAFRASASSPYSTFSIDVDNASYSNVRGYLSRGTLPPADAVRIEELVNYFDYNYPDPNGDHPFAFHSEVVECPWNTEHLVVRLALQGERIQAEQAAACNLVFLMDVSGSMNGADRLPLLKQSFLKLVDHLRPQDQVAIVVYAGAAGLVLESTPGSDKEKIRNAINRLEAGGSTAGGAGIQLAYKVARDNFLPDGVNRVILATDGDFNVGVSSDEGLVGLIEEKRKDGVFLSILGFGTGNYQDAKMEKLADNGNGNYYFVDKLAEGERVLVDEMSGTLHAIAKDVKLQIKFNPSKVAAYRLIGYENRVLAAKDFDNDAKDAGELGAGHRVTALYEVVPVGAEVGFDLDTAKGEDYQLDEKRPELLSSHDLLLARLRYKEPKDSISKLIEHLVEDERKKIAKASEGTRFAMAVAQWGMALRGSKYIGTGSYSDVLSLAKGAMSDDPGGYRKEFVELVEKAKGLTGARGAVGTR